MLENTPDSRMQDIIYDGERIDTLHTADLKIIQNKKMFCFGIDAVLLADFSFKKVRELLEVKSCKGNEKGILLLDLCTGNGIVPLLVIGTLLKNHYNMSRTFENVHFSALEIQEKVSDMARRSVLLNRLEDMIEIKAGDLRNISAYFRESSFDIVNCNPPYLEAGKCRQSGNMAKMIARQEICCSIDDVLKAAFYALKDGGDFFMVHRPERFEEICRKAPPLRLKLKEFRFVKPFEDKTASMVLFHFAADKSNAHKDIAACEASPFVVYKEKGVYTDEIMTVYGRK